jgi:hypothetical protein
MVGAHQALIWLAQDAGGAVSAGDTYSSMTLLPRPAR